ncbi:MAG: hypothetical protein JWQ14_2504 [Adhaeribacter sp.]|nr:hypothetical protein [Adhaeribacter sp.]
MMKHENPNLASEEVMLIKRLRQQLADFDVTEGNLEVVFKMPDGRTITVPVNSKVKSRIISKEVRNYLAEEQLLKQCQDDF